MLIFLNDFRQCSVKCSDTVKQKEPKSSHYREKKASLSERARINHEKNFGWQWGQRKALVVSALCKTNWAWRWSLCNCVGDLRGAEKTTWGRTSLYHNGTRAFFSPFFSLLHHSTFCRTCETSLHCCSAGLHASIFYFLIFPLKHMLGGSGWECSRWTLLPFYCITIRYFIILQSQVFLNSSTKNIDKYYHGNCKALRPLYIQVHRLILGSLDYIIIIDYPWCYK